MKNNPVFWSRLGFCYDPPLKDENGNIIYKKSNSKGEVKPETVKKYGKNISNLINPLQKALDKYYMDFIAPKMFKYELVK